MSQQATTPSEMIVKETKNVSARHAERRKTIIKQPDKIKPVVIVFGAVNDTNSMAMMLVLKHKMDNYYNSKTVFIYPQEERLYIPAPGQTPAGDKYYLIQERIRVYLNSGHISEVIVYGDIFTNTVNEMRMICSMNEIKFTIISNDLKLRIKEYLNPEKK